MKTCKQCSTQFEVTDADRKVYERFKVPEPTLCPNCRQQRRLAFRNEQNLYQRKCDLCKKDIVSVYSPDKPHTVYCPECFWGDQYDPLKYGREFDFSRPFFEQLGELIQKVPLLSNTVFNCVNCDYNSFCVNSKNCYMSTRVGNSEDVLYSYRPIHSLGCVDCYGTFKCQYCYECIDCWNCYNLKFCQLCTDTSDSAFCYDCIGCKHCFGCVDLRNAEYHIFNEKYSKEEYEKYLGKNNLGSYKNTQNFRKKLYSEEILKKPQRALVIINSENTVGDYIIKSKDIYYSFEVEETDTARYCWGVEYGRDIYDSNFIYYGENCYENIANTRSTNITFGFASFEVNDLMYSLMCFSNTHDCFGCVSLKHQEYCILNKKYSKEEYEELVPKVIEHMKDTKEYGDFFPPSLSPFGYNEIIAQNHFPLKKEEALQKGFNWSDYEPPVPEVEKTISAEELPDNTKDIPDDILNWAIKCKISGKPFKIAPQELKFYRKHNLSIPHKHPHIRHGERTKLINPRKLWERKCDKCETEIQTTYSPDRPETVYCEQCYLKEIY